jgi:hypothetical protein
MVRGMGRVAGWRVLFGGWDEKRKEFWSRDTQYYLMRYEHSTT